MVGHYGFASVPLVWDKDGQFHELLLSGLHSSLLGDSDPLNRASASASASEASMMLSWLPPIARPRQTSAIPKAAASAYTAPDLFICHSSDDKEIAHAICEALESGSALRCWIAPRDINPGTTWAASIIEGIEASRAMLLIVSKNSNASPHVLREVERAVNQRLRLFPFFIERLKPSKELEYYLSAVQWIDAWTGPLAGHIQRLRQAITVP